MMHLLSELSLGSELGANSHQVYHCDTSRVITHVQKFVYQFTDLSMPNFLLFYDVVGKHLVVLVELKLF